MVGAELLKIFQRFAVYQIFFYFIHLNHKLLLPILIGCIIQHRPHWVTGKKGSDFDKTRE